ncbi:arginine decarboxylase [Capsicum chacoense]
MGFPSTSSLGYFGNNWSFRPCTRLTPCISQERNDILLGKNKNYTSFAGYNGVPLTEISCVPSAAVSQNEIPPLVGALKASAEENAASFHFPGHNRGQAAPSSLTQLIGAKPFLHDLPELPELDNLFAPEGPILEAQKRAARLFGASETWFLVGGSTCGIQAAIMATCSPGDTLILPRNSHISAISSMVLSGALPKYIVPEYDFKWDVACGITPSQVNDTIKELEMEGRKAAAILVVSPTYHGICSNLGEICLICHSYNIPVIVDEAHGAHLGFHQELPSSSLSQGADLAVQSTHKVLCALTQSSMLHMQGNLVDRERISRSLQMLQSSSPSYLLLASLDATRAQLSENREDIFDKAIDLALEARSLISKIPGISVFEYPSFSSSVHIDPLRLTVGVWQLGLSGFEADDILCNDFGVVCELVGTKSITLAFNLGTQRDHILRLVDGLMHLSQTSHFHQPVKDEGENVNRFVCFDDVRISMSPREAFFASKCKVSIRDSIGEICGELVCPYPPGIPVLIPGEIITEEALNYLQEIRSRGAVITGAADFSLSSFVVCVT